MNENQERSCPGWSGWARVGFGWAKFIVSIGNKHSHEWDSRGFYNRPTKQIEPHWTDLPGQAFVWHRQGPSSIYELGNAERVI